jgi:Co/Zn/Cd efflux system component
METSESSLRRAVGWVAGLNLAYFGIEYSVAIGIGSVSLFADSIDFLEDASINLLILLAFGWTVRARGLIGMVLAALILVPGAATLWTAWEKFALPIPPEPLSLSLTGLGAFVVNLTCAVLLMRVSSHAGSLTRAAFLSARNDVAANVAIVAAGPITVVTASVWPDLLVGLAIFLMNLGAAHEVFVAAQKERATPKP